MPENLIKPKEIILVEDYENDAEQAKRVLEQLGLTQLVRWLKDGASARTYLSSIQNSADAPAILLLDLKLPFISGFEVLKSLRGNAVFDRTLKIALSSLDDAASIKQAYVLGADAFLIKPLTIEDLREAMESFSVPGLSAAQERR